MPLPESLLDRRLILSARRLLLLSVASVGWAVSCTTEAPEEFTFVPVTPHERYEYAVRRLGLDASTMGRQWIDASHRALVDSPMIAPPFREVGVFDPAGIESMAYRFEARRGQAIRIVVERELDSRQVFVDLFRVRDDSTRPFRHAASADSGAATLTMVAPRTGIYLVRVQAELLAVGRYDVTIRLAESLGFPVAGHDGRAIRSRFGAPRDGGRREHHGVDIFAPRGTPVVAAAAGIIGSTRQTTLGGRVVWLRTDAGQSLYHAHLDSVAVRRGRRVAIGDTLGFVGNSGNARTTPPHLHFGIYARRPTDPEPWLLRPPQTPTRLVADTDGLGRTWRVAQPTRARSAPRRGSRVLARLIPAVPVRILGVSGEWYRVGLPGGESGYVPAPDIEGADVALDAGEAHGRIALRSAPGRPAYVTALLQPGERFEVVGRSDDHLYVRSAGGVSGWVEAAALRVAEESL